jgi:phosphatidylglycerophosphate synthase
VQNIIPRARRDAFRRWKNAFDRLKLHDLNSDPKPPAKFGENAFFDVSALFGVPIAALFVPRLVRTDITPASITLFSMLAGFLAAGLIALGLPWPWRFFPFFFYHMKNVLDSADGALARARGRMDRLGRFLDSVTDFLVGLAVFLSMAAAVVVEGGSSLLYLLSLCAFLSSTFSTSYYVFYTIRFAEAVGAPTASRSDETPTEEDEREYRDPKTQEAYRFVYALFRIFYLWQDRLAKKLDDAVFERIIHLRSRDGFISKGRYEIRGYYTDKKLLFLTSFVGLGCHIFFGSVAILFEWYVSYFLFTIAWSFAWIVILVRLRYRRFLTAPIYIEELEGEAEGEVA